MLTLFHHPMFAACRFVRLAFGEYGEELALIEEKPWTRRKEFLALNAAVEAARAAINAIANPHMPEVGERFVGTVVKTTTFGAFVSLSPGKDGLLHISQIRKLAGGKRVENVEDVLGVGQKVQVEIAEIDDRGKLSLVPVVEEDASAEAGDAVADDEAADAE